MSSMSFIIALHSKEINLFLYFWNKYEHLNSHGMRSDVDEAGRGGESFFAAFDQPV